MAVPLSLQRVVPDLGRRAWGLLVGAALAQVGLGLLLPFLFVYASEVRGLGLATAGVVVAAVSVGGVAAVASGGLIDRFGAARVAVAGLLISAVGCLGLAAGREAWSLVASALMQGVGAGCMWNSLFALYAQVVEPRHRSDVFGVNYAVQNLGLGIGAALGAARLNPSDPRSFETAFVVAAACTAGFAALLVASGEAARATRHASTDPASRRGFRALLADRGLLAAVALNGLLVLAAFGQITTAFSAWAMERVPSPTSVIGWAWSANTFTIAVSQLFVLRLVRRGRRTRAACLAAIGFGAAWTLALIAGLVGGALGAAGLVFALAVFGFSETLLSPSVSPMVNDLAPDDLRGRYNALYNLSWQAGLVIGPLIAGWALGQGWGAAYFATLVAGCGAAALLAPGIERVVPVAANRRAGD